MLARRVDMDDALTKRAGMSVSAIRYAVFPKVDIVNAAFSSMTNKYLKRYILVYGIVTRNHRTAGKSKLDTYPTPKCLAKLHVKLHILSALQIIDEY
jgi:hypothetical protein